MTDILDLPEWNVLTSRLEDGAYTIEAECTQPLQACTKCDVAGKLSRHGPKVVTYRDSPIRGAHVQLVAKVQRYKCRECGGTSLQSLSGVETTRRMTLRCAEYIETQCLRDTFTRLAEHIGCDEKTVRNVALDYIYELISRFEPYLPNWLGIGETKLAGEMRCIIIDVERNVPIDILPNRDEQTLAAWFDRFKDRRKVHGVVTDMWRPYHQAVNMMLPGVPLVIDKHHVVRLANYGVDNARIRVGKALGAKVNKAWKAQLNKSNANLSDNQAPYLQMWIDNDPQIHVAYQFKERFCALYNLPKAEAIKALDEWIPAIKSSPVKADFKDLLSALKNWWVPILAYFDHPVTDDFTESLDRLGKVVKGTGRGYTFEVLRARILFSNRGVGRTPERCCASCGGLFYMEEVARYLERDVGNTICLCVECNKRSFAQEVDWEDAIDWAEAYRPLSGPSM